MPGESVRVNHKSYLRMMTPVITALVKSSIEVFEDCDFHLILEKYFGESGEPGD
jgi:hypothetical protein